jgi:hypothetical protein
MVKNEERRESFCMNCFHALLVVVVEGSAWIYLQSCSTHYYY